MYQVNTPAAFSRKLIGFEEFLIRMVEALGITIDRCPKGRPCKIESYLNFIEDDVDDIEDYVYWMYEEMK